MYFQINLLPPIKRKIVFNIYLLYYLKLFVEILLFYSLILAVVFLGSSSFLNKTLQEFQQQTISMDKEYIGINKQIAEINKQLKKIDNVQGKSLDWSDYLYKLFSASGDGIYLNGIDIQKDTKIITISGRAKTRTALLNYQANLNNLVFLKKIELPTSILTAKQDIDFNLKADLLLP